MFNLFGIIRQRVRDAIVGGAADAARDLGLADGQAQDNDAAQSFRAYLQRPFVTAIAPPQSAEPETEETEKKARRR